MKPRKYETLAAAYERANAIEGIAFEAAYRECRNDTYRGRYVCRCLEHRALEAAIAARQAAANAFYNFYSAR